MTEPPEGLKLNIKQPGALLESLLASKHVLIRTHCVTCQLGTLKSLGSKDRSYAKISDADLDACPALCPFPLQTDKNGCNGYHSQARPTTVLI